MRNIMFDLESLEYLKQPHTSAGRIPTDNGYRFYVNSLLDTYEFSLKDREISVKEEAIKREVQLDKIFSVITRMLSTESRYAAVMLTPQFDFTVVKRDRPGAHGQQRDPLHPDHQDRHGPHQEGHRICERDAG